MDQNDKWLEEWKARYDSYRQYRQNYLHTLGFVVTGILGASVLAATGRLNESGLSTLRWIFAILFACLVVGHIVALKSICALGQRIQTLEVSLGFESFKSTSPLKNALWCSLVVSFACMGHQIFRLALAP